MSREEQNHIKKNKRQIVFFFLLVFVTMATGAQTQANVLEQYSGLGLPLVNITTKDGTEPTSDYVNSTLTNVVAKEARMQIYRNDTLWYDSGDFEYDMSGITIKHRGNTSAGFPNKPFKLKLQKKADLIDYREKGDSINYKSKDWVLLNYTYCIDPLVAYHLSRLIGLEYTPRMQYVNVIINNDYRGLYMLMENVTREKECRIIVDKNEGFIIELNPYYRNELFSIPTSLTRFLQWTLKYPKAEDITIEQEVNIREDIEQFEKAISGNNYPTVIDVLSVVRWIMVHDIMGTRDPGGCNIFIARTDRNNSSLMRMPVVWDMAGSMVEPDEWSRSHTEVGLFFSRLFANEQNIEFTNTFCQEWERIKNENVLDSLIAFIDRYPSTPEGKGVKESAPLHMKRWNYDYGLSNLETKCILVKRWMTNRYQWLDNNISAMEQNATGVSKGHNTEIDKQTSTRKVIQNKRLAIMQDKKIYSFDGKRSK